MESLRVLEASVVGLYLLGCVLVGVVFARRARRSEEDYWVAGRFMGTVSGALAIFADVATASSVIGIVGLTYKMGIPFAAMVAAAFTLQFPMALYLVAKPLRDRNLFTLGDFFKERFGKAAHLVYAALTFIFMSAYVVPQIKAGALVASWLVGVSYQAAVIIAGLTCVAYLMLGAMYAISITNIAEGFFDAVGTMLVAIAAIVIFRPEGGLLPLGVAARPTLASLNVPVPTAMGIALTWALWGLVAPMTVMRLMSVRNTKTLRRALGTSTAMAAIIVGFTAVVLASAAAIINPALKNPDMAVMTVLEKFLPPVGRALFAAVLFGAVMTTTDSLIFAAVAAATRDIYQGFINPNASEKTITRMGTILSGLIGTIVTIVALYPLPLISVLAAMTSGAVLSSFMFPVLLGIYWKRCTSRGALFGMLGGFVSYLFLDRSGLLLPTTAMLYALPLSAVLTVLGSLLTSPSRQGP